MVSQQSMCFSLRHGFSSYSVFSFGPYLCLFSRICAAYADVELLDLIYLICSLNLVPIALPDCPTYKDNKQRKTKKKPNTMATRNNDTEKQMGNRYIP